MNPASSGRWVHRMSVTCYTFADRPHATFMWFEYWVAARRSTQQTGPLAMPGPGWLFCGLRSYPRVTLPAFRQEVHTFRRLRCETPIFACTV